MAAKRLKQHKNKISGLIISMCYNKQKLLDFGLRRRDGRGTFYESIKLDFEI